MMTKELVEQMASILSHLNCLPSMHGSVLFPFDIAELMGFQINCDLNKSGRLVYSVENSQTYPQSVEKFKSAYKECFGFEVKETSASIRSSYSSTGSDSIHDIAPSTICSLLRIEIEFNPGEASSIPVFISKISQEAEQWENHFRKMSKNLAGLRQITDRIYEKHFSNS